MNISWYNKLRFLAYLLMVFILPECYSTICEVETVQGYSPTTWRLVNTKVTSKCENVSFPMETPPEFPLCTTCIRSLIIKQLMENQGNTLPPASFVAYNSTTILYLEDLGLETISPGAFESLDRLTELHLKGNKLQELVAGVLYLEQLTFIDLSSNNFKYTDNIAFEDCTLIKSVNLSSNNITAVRTNAGWNNITTLDLSKNEIIDIDLSVLPVKLTVMNLSSNFITSFKGHTNLTYLDLGSNSLKTFDFNFSNRTMEKLNLRNNLISQVFGTYCHIKVIDMSWNKLNSVPCDCSNRSSEVQSLNLANNNISIVIPQRVSELHNLKELHLESNKIKTITAGTLVSLQKLQYLNLSHNEIEEFVFGSLDNIKNLEDLDLSYNKLNRITKYIMHNFANLKHLNLEYNNLNYIDGTLLNNYLPKIWDINIVGNNLTCNNIWNIIAIFNRRPVHFPHGPVKNMTNVHGMPCVFIGNTTEEDFLTSADELTMNKAIANYFNNDYKESNYYKFLEQSQDLNYLIFNATQRIKEASSKIIVSNNTGISGYLITIIIFMMAIACLYALQAYILYNKFRARIYDEEPLV